MRKIFVLVIIVIFVIALMLAVNLKFLERLLMNMEDLAMIEMCGKIEKANYCDTNDDCVRLNVVSVPDCCVLNYVNRAEAPKIENFIKSRQWLSQVECASQLNNFLCKMVPECNDGKCEVRNIC
ncbi:MAG: hypothetical protein WC308_00730 [archaeon]|jgi:hypothetical protein